MVISARIHVKDVEGGREGGRTPTHGGGGSGDWLQCGEPAVAWLTAAAHVPVPADVLTRSLARSQHDGLKLLRGWGNLFLELLNVPRITWVIGNYLGNWELPGQLGDSRQPK